MSLPLVLDAAGSASIDERTVLATVRSAFEQLASGRAVQPLQVVTDLPGGGDVIAYQAVLADAGVYAVKVSPYIPQADGPPIVTAWTMLVSTTTGQPLLLADSAALTTERTAATTAVAADLLARPDARTLAIIGAGPVAQAHLRYARLVRPFDDIRVFSRSGIDAARIAGFGDDVTVAASVAEAVAGADVIMACTSAAEAVVDVTALPGGVLVTSVSTNAVRAHEIDPAALLGLDVYCDTQASALNAAGDFVIAAEQHGFTADHVRGDLPSLLDGSAPGPSGDRPVYFRSVGLGIEDAAVAVAALAGAS